MLWAGGCSLIPGRGSIFLFSIASRLAVGPNQSPIQWVLRAVPSRLQWLGCEPDDLLPSSVDIKNEGAIPPFLALSSWCGV
jgi:hypothetical protein